MYTYIFTLGSFELILRFYFNLVVSYFRPEFFREDLTGVILFVLIPQYPTSPRNNPPYTRHATVLIPQYPTSSRNNPPYTRHVTVLIPQYPTSSRNNPPYTRHVTVLIPQYPTSPRNNLPYTRHVTVYIKYIYYENHGKCIYLILYKVSWKLYVHVSYI